MTGPLRTAAEVAELLRVPESWVRDHAQAGDIPYRRLGRHLRFAESDVAAIVAAAARGPEPAVTRKQPPAAAVQALQPSTRRRPRTPSPSPVGKRETATA